MVKTSLNQEVQIGSQLQLSSDRRVELGCDVQSVSIDNMNDQGLKPFWVVHPNHEEEMQLLEEATLENDEQIPSTSSMDINFTQTSNNQENFNQPPSQEFQNEVCTCCHRNLFHRGTYVIFKRTNYNFDHAIVNRALFHKYRYCPPGRMECICKVCHNHLRAKEPRMPMNAVAQLGQKAGENFLKALQNKPEFVCTCCHHMLFRKMVVVFHENKYDFGNTLVERALSSLYKYKSECHNNEFICVTCHNNLKRRCPKMPAQAVANGLSLPDVPNELSNLTEIERRLISLHIPFMKILALHRAGSHFKINGPCVNVPTTLSRVCELLPRLPDEAQLIPMKLKWKIEFKGYHMYGSIRKEVVMNAVKWLRENNEHYKDIELNDLWDDEWMQSEFDTLLQPTTTQETQTGVQNDHNELATGCEAETQADQEIVTTENECLQSDLDNLPNHPAENPIHSDSFEELTVTNMDTQEDTQSESGDEKDRKELEEDQAAADRNAEICRHPYSSTLQINNLEDAVYSVAPGEGNTPQYILMDHNFEVLAFPDLFPTGRGGYDTVNVRETDLSLCQYYQQRLLNVDGRFAKDIEYIACAQYSTELKQLKSDANIALRITKGRTFRGQMVNAGMLKNPGVVQDLICYDQAYKFMKNVWGSPAYWQHQLYEVLAMIRTLDIPTWFLTLSAADMHWPEIIQAIGIQFGKRFTREEVMQMDWEMKSNYLRSNPITACRMFQSRVESFFSEYILSSDNPLGEVHDYVIKIEFQERGAPHAHCLLWVKNAPQIDVDSDEDVCSFVDKYISGRIPSPTDDPDNDDVCELVKRLETHSHSAYCR